MRRLPESAIAVAEILMNQELKEAKRTLRAFMRANYTDERLGWLLAHARDAKLSFFSCCCFIGVATADHALQGITDSFGDHYDRAQLLPGGDVAESAYCELRILRINGVTRQFDDEVGRRRLIPMIRAEMRRRERLRASAPAEHEPVSLCASNLYL